MHDRSFQGTEKLIRKRSKNEALVFFDLFSNFAIDAFLADPFEKQSFFPVVAFANVRFKDLSNEPDMVSNFYCLNNLALNAQRALLINGAETLFAGTAVSFADVNLSASHPEFSPQIFTASTSFSSTTLTTKALPFLNESVRES